jgi:hypothetical protein
MFKNNIFFILYNYDKLNHLKYHSKLNKEKLNSTLIHFAPGDKIIDLTLLSAKTNRSAMQGTKDSFRAK